MPDQTELEAAIVQMWEEVLGRPVTSADDFFVDHGGTSLDAVDVLAAVEDRFGAEVSVRTFFAHPTPTELAAVVASTLDAPEGSAPGPDDARRTR